MLNFTMEFLPGFAYNLKYGRQQARLRFVLAGLHGAVVAIILLGIYADVKAIPPSLDGIYIHSKVQFTSDPEPTLWECQFTGGECYCESYPIQEEVFFEMLTKGGADAIKDLLIGVYTLHLAEAGTNYVI